MNINKNLLFAFAVILAYVSTISCNRTDYSKEIAQVDSLQAIMNLMKFQNDSIDSLQVISLSPLIQEDIRWISDSLSKETLTKSKVFIQKVRTGEKILRNFPMEYYSIKKEINYSLTQLNDLHQDLIEGSIEKAEASKYIEDEVNAGSVIESHHLKMMKRLQTLEDYPEVRKEFYLMLKQEDLLPD